MSGLFRQLLDGKRDVALVGAMIFILTILFVPVSAGLLDFLLIVNFSIALLVLLITFLTDSPLSFSTFPSLLLFTTLFRLALNVSATRLILGGGSAGHVIGAVGAYVVGGNYVIGLVVFLILVVVQYVVVTSGAQRVAEVAARFTLDSMPGKQMSIDADMNMGLIDEAEARRRRSLIEREANFYGAMKFVKGDAIASIVITLINIVGGLIIGIAMNGMSAMEAVQTYSILTIGNGLVSQIPALLISISAGMVVTRVASENKDANLGKDVAGQILGQPKAIAVASGLLTVMAIIPGLPKIPFFILAALTGALAYGLFRAQRINAEALQKSQAASSGRGPEVQISVTVPLLLQVGEGLTPFIDRETESGKKFFEQLVSARNSLYYELGVVFPALQVTGHGPGEAGSFSIWANEVPIVTGQIRMESVMVNDSVEKIAMYGFKGEATTNPATGKPAAWIVRTEAERARAAGYQVWDAQDILLLQLARYLRKNARDFVGIQEVQMMVAAIKQHYPTLVDETVPKPVSLQTLTEILRRLVEEEVSIRDMKGILQTLCEWGRVEHEVLALTEYVRAGLKRKICYQISQGRPLLFVYRLDPEIEEIFRNSIRQSASGAYLAMDPAHSQLVLEAARAQLGDLPPGAQKPVIVTDGEIRRFVKRLLDFAISDVTVLSYDQITPQINLQPLGTIAPPARAQIASD